ncbi:hypothetical protein BGZ97_000733 [Linnemannia gamsii]|uniref:Uncharacterized protein n=1 Tax=Linnemannia gamsii TaxID=64522 RepID=A0A9P6R1V7_9FUNG|nr:hypothetical protein BGZ97_000733 [Linnemannia gamsii]
MARPAPVAPAAFAHPAPVSFASPVNSALATGPAVWTPPANDALTYTSFAGLLSTVAPAFYPTPLNSAAPSRAIDFPMSQQPPPPPTPISHRLIPHMAPTALAVPSTKTRVYDLPAPALSSTESLVTIPSESSAVPKENESTATQASLSATAALSDTSSSSSIDSASLTKQGTTSLSTTRTSTTTSTTTTSTEVTVSTTTTTRGDTTSTRTTVGKDGTTTVLTEYPTSSRRTTTRSSGAEARWLGTQGRQDPSVGSVVGYLKGLLNPEAQWSMIVAAMIATLALPGAVALLV